MTSCSIKSSVFVLLKLVLVSHEFEKICVMCACVKKCCVLKYLCSKTTHHMTGVNSQLDVLDIFYNGSNCLCRLREKKSGDKYFVRRVTLDNSSKCVSEMYGFSAVRKYCTRPKVSLQKPFQF